MPAKTLIHELFGNADHRQPVGAMTFTDMLPPLAAKFWLVGLISIVHAPA
jgi:hypothetical protein